MFIALDENNIRIASKDAIKGKEYKCPICEERLEPRKGEVRLPHFAHWKKSECLDSWSHDMSEWHYTWQNQFPTECQEVVVEANGKKHRADVLIEERKLVIEFQHSRISPEEFEERNMFYSKCGYHVVWLFDMSEDFDEEKLSLSEEESVYDWKRPWTTFTQRNSFYDSSIDIFLEHGDLIERFIYYDSDNKQLKTSVVKKEKPFAWSKQTFILWLNKTCKIHSFQREHCPKCGAPMEIRQYSLGGALWGCSNYGSKNCRGTIGLGSTPVKVSYDDKCPFCDGRFRFGSYGMRCEDCNYTISFNIK